MLSKAIKKPSTKANPFFFLYKPMLKKGLILLLCCTLLSCKKEKIRGCTDSQAQNYQATAESDDGSCRYLRDRYIGDYQGINVCGNTADSTFTFSVQPSPDNINRIQLSGIPLSGNFSYADLKSDPNTFFIPPQLFLSDLDSSNVSGGGNIVGDSLFIQIIWENSSGIDTCYTKAIKLNDI